MLLGTHLTADLTGCRADHPWMIDAEALRQTCAASTAQAGLTSVGQCFHQFQPHASHQGAGVTGVILLAESHLAVHTWPEHRTVTIDIYVCHLLQDNQRKAQHVLDQLIEGFAPKRAHVQLIERRIPADANT